MSTHACSFLKLTAGGVGKQARLGGEKAVTEHIHGLAVKAGKVLAQLWGTEVLTEGSMFGALINVRLPCLAPCLVGPNGTSTFGMPLRRKRLCGVCGLVSIASCFARVDFSFTFCSAASSGGAVRWPGGPRFGIAMHADCVQDSTYHPLLSFLRTHHHHRHHHHTHTHTHIRAHARVTYLSGV